MRILLLDIETSPNIAHVWGLYNQNISLNQLLESSRTMCWAAKWYGEKDVYFSSENETTHRKMIKQIHGLLDEADTVIHYNGKRFDMPCLNKEFLLLGYKPPSPYKQVDLLQTARSQFKFPSNKLDYVSQMLGVGQKVKHEGHELWLKCLNKDQDAWKRMEKYNIQDVILLEQVYDKLLPWIKSHPNHNVHSEERVCPNCGSHKLHKRGTYCTMTNTYYRLRCMTCGKWSRSNSALKNLKKSDSVISIKD